ncbi:MAG TPA: hypothetical protein VFP68_05310 [Burkholderiaceae bacterium]|nr:hypothetical protein [Burkholderiaceae bacterium]
MTSSFATAALDMTSRGAAGAPMQASYGASLNDVATFEQAVSRAQGHAISSQTHSIHSPGPAMQALLRPLEQINAEASRISAQAKSSTEGGQPLSPGEMVSLTVKCHEFMFHCQLTANVANRTSDGLQQLFRQQA